MDYQIREVENGTEITVDAEEAAVVVKEEGEERIYLPEEGSSQSSYYTDGRKGLSKAEERFRVVHNGVPDTVKVFSTQEN